MVLYRQLGAKYQHLVQVLVLRLQTRGSVEERILEASSQKRSLADRSITGRRLHCLLHCIATQVPEAAVYYRWQYP